MFWLLSCWRPGFQFHDRHILLFFNSAFMCIVIFASQGSILKMSRADHNPLLAKIVYCVHALLLFVYACRERGSLSYRMVVRSDYLMSKQNNEWLYSLYRGFILDYTQIVIFCCEYQYVNVLFEIVFVVFDYYCFEGHRED